MKSVVRNTTGEQVLGNEVADTLIEEGCKAVVVMMFVSENHGYVTVCHGDDFVSSGSAAALDEVDRVLTTHFDTKILPGIGPTAPAQNNQMSPQRFETGVKQQTC